ncbi:keywimysin-related RiPP [Streptomyces sp. NPDC046261]
MRAYERPTLVLAGGFRARTRRKPGPWWEWIGPNYLD